MAAPANSRCRGPAPTPRSHLAAAECLAFDLGLVVLADMTSYCEALRAEVAAREEVAGVATAAGDQRVGRIRGRTGSATQLPVLSTPDDVTRSIPDLTGYLTQGPMVLSRELAWELLSRPAAELRRIKPDLVQRYAGLGVEP